MDFKLAKLTLNNFKSSTQLEIRFGGNVNFLIGVNGSGKTMIGTALQYLFEGKKFFNNKYRRRIITDGKDKMKVTGEFVHAETGKTLIISQSLTTKDNPNLKIEGGAGIAVCMEDVLDMIDMLYLRPFDIIKKTPIEQARLLGVDTTTYDKDIAFAKDNLKLPRASLASIKTKLKDYPTEPEKVEPVNLKELYDERDKIKEFNNKQDRVIYNISTAKINIESIGQQILKWQNSLEEAEVELGKLPKSEPMKSLDDVNVKINNASETAKEASKYENYITLTKSLEQAKLEFAEYEKKVTKAEESKIAYIKSCDVPNSVSFDDDGGMQITAFGQKAAYLNEDFFSHGQILKMAIQLCIKKIMKSIAEDKNIIPLIFIDNAESLDEEKLEFIDDMADKYKIQFILAYQSDEPKAGKSCIMLEEKVIKKYNDA